MKVMSDFAWSRYLKAVNHAFRIEDGTCNVVCFNFIKAH
jgi:hypothetical protein